MYARAGRPAFARPYVGVHFTSTQIMAQSAGAVEYTDCISAEEKDPFPNECPVYDIKQFDVESPVIQSSPSLL